MGRKRFAIVVIVLLIGAGLWSWIAFNTGSEWKASLAGLLPHKTANAAVQYDPAKQRTLEVKNQEASWGGILVKGCEAGMADFEAANFDTDGDDVADKVCWRSIQTSTDGNFIGVAVIARAQDGTVKRSGYAVLPAGPSGTAADKPTISRKAWTDKELSNHQLSGGDLAAPVSVAVSHSGEAAWLFWPKDAKGEDVTLISESRQP